MLVPWQVVLVDAFPGIIHCWPQVKTLCVDYLLFIKTYASQITCLRQAIFVPMFSLEHATCISLRLCEMNCVIFLVAIDIKRECWQFDFFGWLIINKYSSFNLHVDYFLIFQMIV